MVPLLTICSGFVFSGLKYRLPIINCFWFSRRDMTYGSDEIGSCFDGPTNTSESLELKHSEENNNHNVQVLVHYNYETWLPQWMAIAWLTIILLCTLKLKIVQVYFCKRFTFTVYTSMWKNENTCLSFQLPGILR